MCLFFYGINAIYDDLMEIVDICFIQVNLNTSSPCLLFKNSSSCSDI